MGAWGQEPWDNDTAGDFFGDLWEGTPVADRVLDALRSGDGEVMVAALWLCSELCRVYVWPIERYDETLSAGITAADLVLAREDDDGLLDLWDESGIDLAPQIAGYRATLVARRDHTPDD